MGVSPDTFRKAEAVVDAAEKDPDLKPVAEEMERTGNVHRAYVKIRPPSAPILGVVRGQRPPPLPDSRRPPSNGALKAAVFGVVNDVHDSMLGPYGSYDSRTVKAFTLAVLTKLEKVL